MNHPVVTALLPVLLLIGTGVLAGRLRLIDAAGTRGLSNLTFLLLSPALLFRTMGRVHVEQIDFRPLAVYFLAAGLLFVLILFSQGLNRRSGVLALAGTFSNTMMIGVPLISLLHGEAGLVNLFALVSLHTLVMLTLATVVLEFALVREAQGSGEPRHAGLTVLLAVRNSVLHPVPMPIILGLVFAQTGWQLPGVVDRPLELLGQAFAPMALLLVGITLAASSVGSHWRGALTLAALKNIAHPLLVLAIGWLLGLHGVPFAVMVLASSLPIGANVFLFSQRYQAGQELVTASVAMSSVLALVSITVILLLRGA